ncbi:hypothetical protein [Cyclobacterium xiamenense]|uniref:hypothetical protein n=1 Tax=Cyclobacterium xiamenense TaxID=1297121 RepID=UPI0012B6E7A8|nr:hypothetical protein [Cyclobacterium xiamenense]
MKKSVLIIALFLALQPLAFAQDKIPQFDTRHKNVYAEFLGSHILAGVNYDMRLKKGVMDGIGFRAGVGGISTTTSDIDSEVSLGIVTFPLEINHLVGKKRSSFVTGAGLLPVYASFSSEAGTLDDYEYITGEGFAVVGGFLSMGYRYQPKKSGVMFQFHWNPLILRGTGFTAGWFGLGIGVGFK